MGDLTLSELDSFKTRHSTIIGITRSGKTTFAAYVVQQLQSKGVHTIFVDPKHDAAWDKLGTVCYTAMEVYNQLLKKNPAIVVKTPGAKEEKLAMLERITDLTFGLQKKPGFKRIRRLIAIDELQLFVKKGGSDAIEKIWTIGAGVGIVGMALSQRIQLLNETVWSQSDNKVIFRIEDRPDYLKSRNLQHYVEQQEFFDDSMNRFWFYYTTGGGKWKKHDPVPIGRPKRRGPLRLKRWR